MSEKVVFEAKPARYRVEYLNEVGPKNAWTLWRYEKDLGKAQKKAQSLANSGHGARVIDTEARA